MSHFIHLFPASDYEDNAFALRNAVWPLVGSLVRKCFSVVRAKPLSICLFQLKKIKPLHYLCCCITQTNDNSVFFNL